jgi:molybdate-binding protein
MTAGLDGLGEGFEEHAVASTAAANNTASDDADLGTGL